jgi:ornithine cyclodeaminase
VSAPEILGRDAIMRRIDPAAARAAVRAVFATPQPDTPLPLHLDLPEGEVHVKAARDAGQGIGIVKVASAAYGVAAGSDGAVLAFDAATARLRAVLLDGGWLTDLRTAAVSALCVEVLAGPGEPRVTIIGAGTQARFHIQALRALNRDLAITVAARRQAAAAALAEELGGGLAATDALEQAVRAASVVITVTPARAPVIRRAWVRPDALVVAVGADAPGKQELEPAILADAELLVADSPRQAATLGDSQHLDAERQAAVVPLADLIRGDRAAAHGRLRVCDLTGLGACDAAIAAHVLADEPPLSALHTHQTDKNGRS